MPQGRELSPSNTRRQPTTCLTSSASGNPPRRQMTSFAPSKRSPRQILNRIMHPPMKSTIRGLFCVTTALVLCSQLTASAKDVVYLTPGLDLPFWRYLSEGIESVAKKEGYGYQAFDSHNDAQTQLKNAQDAIARGVAGILISPTDSSTCPSVLSLAQ